jgi:hypothetical protein
MVGGQASRVAVVREGLATKTPAQLDVLGDRLLTSVPEFTNNMFEWDWRAATRVTRAFGGRTEATNTIGVLKRLEVTLPGEEPTDRLMVTTDVNTVPQQINPRFSPVEAEAFVVASAAWHAQLEQVLRTLVEGN